jgi:hypothetical protein
VAQGEAALAACDAPAAQSALEQAAAVEHASEIEVSLVRTYMQAGAYRQAMSFAAHAAGVHPEYPQAAALYAWLLYAGGQREVAVRVLEAALTAAPQQSTLLAVRNALAQPLPVPDPLLLQPPLRFAPYANVDTSQAGVMSSATLIDGGRRALAPATGVDGAVATSSRIWLRNGLGLTEPATVDRRFEAGGASFVILRPAAALPWPREHVISPRAPFAGSPGYSVEYVPTAQAALPAWPLLSIGFVGRAAPQEALPALGIEMPAGPRGGPVFDAAGRMVGVAAVTAGRDRLVPLAELQAHTGDVFGVPSAPGAAARVALDVIYERSMLLTLQVVVDRPVEQRHDVDDADQRALAPARGAFGANASPKKSPWTQSGRASPSAIARVSR